MNDAIQFIVEQEGLLLECLKDFTCATLGVIEPVDGEELDVTEDKVDIARKLICAMAAKESSIGEVLEGSATVIYADKGIVPCCDGDDDDCGC